MFSQSLHQYIIVASFHHSLHSTLPLLQHRIFTSSSHRYITAASFHYRPYSTPSSFHDRIAAATSHRYIIVASLHHSLHSTRRPQAHQVIFAHQIRQLRFDHSRGHPNTISINKYLFIFISKNPSACIESENDFNLLRLERTRLESRELWCFERCDGYMYAYICGTKFDNIFDISHKFSMC